MSPSSGAFSIIYFTLQILKLHPTCSHIVKGRKRLHVHCLFRERASEHRSVMVSVLLPLLSCLFLSVNSQGLLGVYLVYSDSGSYNSTSALNGAMDAVQEFAGHLPGHSINFTTLDDKVLFRSKYFYYYSLYSAMCPEDYKNPSSICPDLLPSSL